VNDPRSEAVQPQDAYLQRKLQAENFPVALRLLPAALRADLTAVYNVVRVIDDLGDEASGDRTAQLTAFRIDLALVWSTGRPAAPVLRDLVTTVRRRNLSWEPFDRLVQANLMDQQVSAYATLDDVLGYCALSAAPIGQLVLEIFGVATPARQELSDRVCNALQLLEHWQDIAEDRAQGRIYLPQDDLARFGVTPADLDADRSSGPVRELVAYETMRTRMLLESGRDVTAGLHGWAKLAVAGYIAGGLATADALQRPDVDVLAVLPKPGKADVARHLAAQLRRSAPATPTEQAYVVAEQITRTEAKNFYYGIRLLSAPKRSALCALYALARRADDIGDGDLPDAQKSIELAQLRAQVHQLDTPGAPEIGGDPVLLAVADAGRRYPIPFGAFEELVDGVEMDVVGRSYQSFDELVEYCRCVAGAIGRLCLGVFGHKPHPDAGLYADQLGIALQQTNILRDIREDLGNGRVYVPQDDLDRFGVTLKLDEHGNLADPDGGLAEFIRFSAARNRTWYADGLRLIPLLDRRSAACATAMAGIYRQLLTEIENDPTLVYTQRLSLSGGDKAKVAVRALAGRKI
jgi:phytoene synthase